MVGRGQQEAVDLAALEPLGGGLEADDGVALRHRRGPRGGRRPDRRGRRSGSRSRSRHPSSPSARPSSAASDGTSRASGPVTRPSTPRPRSSPPRTGCSPVPRTAPRRRSIREVIDVGHGARCRRGRLSPEQADASRASPCSGRQVDLLVGPAGAGKTTAMRALHAAWIAEHGQGSVVGLAPSAAAAEVLAEDLGIGCDNTAKWLHEHDRGNAEFAQGPARDHRRGDPRRHPHARPAHRPRRSRRSEGAAGRRLGTAPVGRRGRRVLAARRSPGSDAPELTEVHRFTHEWEKQATARPAQGRAEVIGTYARHERVREGTTDQMLDAAYPAWRADTRRGLDSVLVTEATPIGPCLNERARAERILDGDDDSEPGGRARRRAHAPRSATSSSPAGTTGASARCAAAGSATATAGASLDVRRRRLGRGPSARDAGWPHGRAARRVRRRSTSTSATPSPPTAPRASPSTPPTSSSPPRPPERTSTSP